MNLQLRTKGQSMQSTTPQHSFKTAPTPSESNHAGQPAVQQSSSASVYVPESGVEAAEEGFGLEEEGLIIDFCFLVFVLFPLYAFLAHNYLIFWLTDMHSP